jgi:hypothetical protein
MNVRQPAAAPADRRADRLDDDGLSHPAILEHVLVRRKHASERQVFLISPAQSGMTAVEGHRIGLP